MKAPVVWVTAALTTAIVLTATLLIATGTRGETIPFGSSSTEPVLHAAPEAK